MDMALAQRILAHLSIGDGARAPPAGAHRRGCAYARGQLRLQAFVAPASWAAPCDAADGDAPAPCAVCLEPVLPGERCVAGPACLHRLHEACALDAAPHTTLCPTCRAPLLVADCDAAPGEQSGGESEEEGSEGDALPSRADASFAVDATVRARAARA
jgi:hypothetical protein